jgi:hypothetical protein
VLFGWDISTSVIGTTVLNDDGSFYRSFFCDLRKIDAEPIKKALEAHLYVASFALDYAKLGPTHHFIEDRLQSFAAGRTMQQTLLKLAAFNSVISYLIWYEFTTGPDHEPITLTHLHPSRVKSIMRKEGLVIPKGADKKELTLAFVAAREKDFVVTLNKNDRPQPYCYDMADSYCIARAGYLSK